MKKTENKKSKSKAAVPGAVQTKKRKCNKKRLTISATEAALKYSHRGESNCTEHRAIDAMARISNRRRKAFSVKMAKRSKDGRQPDDKTVAAFKAAATDFVNKLWDEIKSNVSITCRPSSQIMCGTTESVIGYQALLLSNALETVSRLGLGKLSATFSHKGRYGEVEFYLCDAGPRDLDILAERLRSGSSSYSISLHHYTRRDTRYTVERLDDSVVVKYENA